MNFLIFILSLIISNLIELADRVWKSKIVSLNSFNQTELGRVVVTQNQVFGPQTKAQCFS